MKIRIVRREYPDWYPLCQPMYLHHYRYNAGEWPRPYTVQTMFFHAMWGILGYFLFWRRKRDPLMSQYL